MQKYCIANTFYLFTWVGGSHRLNLWELYDKAPTLCAGT